MRVVVTRPAEQAGPLVERLTALGHEVVLCPLVRLEPLGDEPLDVAGYDWVVVTSRTGAAELARRAPQLARRAQGAAPRIAAIGPGTAAALAEQGLQADFIPEVSSQEGLVAAFPRPAGRVLFAGAEHARRLLVEELAADFVALYRTVEIVPEHLPEGDLAIVASPSAARALAAAGASAGAGAGAGADVAAGAPDRAALAIVSIGPQTTAAALAVGLRVAAEAPTFDLDGLVAAVEELAAR